MYGWALLNTCDGGKVCFADYERGVVNEVAFVKNHLLKTLQNLLDLLQKNPVNSDLFAKLLGC